MELLEPRTLLATLTSVDVTPLSQGSTAHAEKSGFLPGLIRARSVSDGGRFVAFESLASDLVAGDTNDATDVFLVDRVENSIQRLSVNESGQEVPEASRSPHMSADGRYIVFGSLGMLTADTPDDPNEWHTYLFDREANTLQRISDGGNNNGITDPAISADGSTIAFSESVIPVRFPQPRITVFDRVSGQRSQIEQTSLGGSQFPSISQDGRYIAFESEMVGIGFDGSSEDIFRHDRITGETIQVSRTPDGQDVGGSAESNANIAAAISGDGNLVAYQTTSNELIGDGVFESQAVIHDVSTGENLIVSTSPGGALGNGSTVGFFFFSGDGKRLVFESFASNLLPEDNDTDGDIYLWEQDTNSLQLLSASLDGTKGNGESLDPFITNDGTLVAFYSQASNLVPGGHSPPDDLIEVGLAGEQKVNSTDNDGDTNPGDGTIHTGQTIVIDGQTVPKITLAAAIQEYNAGGGNQTVEFNLPAVNQSGVNFAGGVWTITPDTSFVIDKNSVIVDGKSQAGSGNTPVIFINGANAGLDDSGIKISGPGGGSTIRGLAIGNFKSYGVELINSESSKIESSHIGTDADGTTAAPNLKGGVLVSGGSGNTIGGSLSERGSLISGNIGNGMEVRGGAFLTRVENSKIGTDRTGTAALPNTGDGIQLGSIDDGQAVESSIGEGGGNLISGNGGFGIHLVNPQSSDTVIDSNSVGTNQAGTAAIANTLGGIRIEDAPDTTVNENLISGNSGPGLVVFDVPGDGVVMTGTIITGNTIGLNRAGDAAVGNQGDGIRIHGAVNTRIGSAFESGRNVISGNQDPGELGIEADGIELTAGADGTIILGNYIGTNAAGTTNDSAGQPPGNDTLENKGRGILINNSSDITIGGTEGVTVGGPLTGAGNLISGNRFDGIKTDAPGSSEKLSNIIIEGNYIGVDRTGTQPIGQLDGIELNDAINSRVGGTTAEARNILSASSGNGLQIASSSLIEVLGNFIGTDVSGFDTTTSGGKSLGHDFHSVDLSSSQQVTLIGNTIAGGGLGGIALEGNGHTIQANNIGVGADGVTPLGNGGPGILIEPIGNNNNNLIGGTDPGQGNTIAFNRGGGVIAEVFQGQSGTRFGVSNQFLGNSIHSNAIDPDSFTGPKSGLGIDLRALDDGASGVTPNDLRDEDDNGPNLLQNFPVLTLVREGDTPGTTRIEGTLDGMLGRSYRIEFFSNDPLVVDPSGHGEGQVFEGFEEILLDTNPLEFTVDLPTTISDERLITATATDLTDKNTSEFSLARGFAGTKIQGIKFDDTNGDGLYDILSEPELDNVEIKLFRDGSEVDSATTSNGGRYSFNIGAPGEYEIREPEQPGFVRTDDNEDESITITQDMIDAGISPDPINVGNFQLMLLSGMKFDDLDGDGMLDGGEPPLAGWTIELRDALGTFIGDPVVTGPDGRYAFPPVGPDDLFPPPFEFSTEGVFTIEEKPPANVAAGTFTQTLKAGDVSPVSGANINDLNFGNFFHMTVRGIKFNDFNGNGVLDSGEAGGVDNVTIRIDINSDSPTGADRTGTPDPVSGQYEITNIGLTDDQINHPNRTFTIGETLPDGWFQSSPLLPTFDIVSGMTYDTGTDIGNFELMTIEGRKFDDLNGNGRFDGGEPGLGGWTIELDLDQDGTADATETTASDGTYRFEDIGPRDDRTIGDFTIRERPDAEQSSRYQQTFPQPVPPGQYTHAITSGLQVSGDDFGNFEFMTLGGVKYDDLNGNGVRDPGEPGLSGWKIDLDINSDGTTDRTTTTQNNGTWRIDDVETGDPDAARTYTVSESPSPQQALDYVQTGPATGTITRDLHSGEVRLDHHFGNFELVTLSGVKFADLDGDGIRDPSEPGLADFTIELDEDSDGSIDQSVVTDTSGRYRFERIGPGTHTISELQQIGYEQTAPVGDTHVVTAVSGEDRRDLEFGNRPLVSFLAGTKFLDANQDTLRNETPFLEPGVPNWTIFIDGNDDGVLNNAAASNNNVCDSGALEPCQLTDENGNYLFVVDPGSYIIREVVQDRWTQTFPGGGGAQAATVSFPDEGIAGLDFGNFNDPPVGTLIAPAPDETTETDLGYVDILWIDPLPTPAGIDPATVDPDDLLIEIDSVRLTIDRVEAQGGDIYRYFYDDDADALLPGDVVVTLKAGAVQDTQGSPNLPSVATFTFVAQRDYGDAPTSDQSGFAASYPTLSPSGASHNVGSGLFLGADVDTESNGQPTADASGDGGDEDGLLLINGIVANDNSSTGSSFVITASDAGKLDAWIDFNRDGDWLDLGEQLFSASVDLDAGQNFVSFDVPAGAASGNSFARFRFSSSGGLQFDGHADDGEVEDYQVNIIDGNGTINLTLNTIGLLEIRAVGDDVVVNNDQGTLFRLPGSIINDVTVGGSGQDDVVRLGNLNSIATLGRFEFDGGDGSDSVVLADSDQVLDLTDVQANVLSNVETIDIIGASPNTLILDRDSVLQSTDGDDLLQVVHDEDDTLVFAGDGWEVQPPIFAGVQLHVLTNGLARVQVDNTLPFSNPLSVTDVNFNGETTALDALQIINFIGRFGETSVDVGPPASASELPERYYDVNGSLTVSALDALNVINALGRAASGSRELVFAPPNVAAIESGKSNRPTDNREYNVDPAEVKIVGKPAGATPSAKPKRFVQVAAISFSLDEEDPNTPEAIWDLAIEDLMR